MPVVRKQLLAPATYFPPRGGPLKFTRADLEEMCAATSALLASGRGISVPFEHQDDAVPLSHAERAANLVKHNSGWVERVYMDGDEFWADLDVDADTADRIRDGRIRHVSPEIRSVFPADGTVHRNVITHVALTCQPVWKDQKPFYVPSDWVGDDGAVLVAAAAERLSLAGTIQLSMACVATDDDVARLSYHVPNRGLAVFRGRVHEGRVPKDAIKAAEDAGDAESIHDLLVRLVSRDPRSVPRAFASKHAAPYAASAKPAVSDVTAKHLLKDSPHFTPFGGASPSGEPALVWEDKSGVHVVDGHDAVPDEGKHPVAPVQVSSPEEAAGVALVVRLMEGFRVEDEDLDHFFRDTGLSAADVVEEMSAAGFEVHPDDARRLEASCERACGEIDEEEGSGRGEDSEAEVPPVEPGVSAADDPGGQGSVYGEAVPPLIAIVGRFSMPLTDYVPDADDAAETDDAGESPAPGGPPDLGGSDAAPPEPKGDEDMSQLQELLTKAGVHLPDQFLTMSMKEQVKAMLHAMQVLDKAGVFDDPIDDAAGEMTDTTLDEPAAGAGDPPPLEREDNTMAGTVAMSLADQHTAKIAELQSQVKRLSLTCEFYQKDAAGARLSQAGREIGRLVEEGRCTKAKGDDILSRLTKHQLSWASESPNAEVAVALAELNVVRENPKGTFGVTRVEEAPDSTQLSMAAVQNGTPWDAPSKDAGLSPDRLKAVKAEFASLTGHRYRNGTN